MNTDDIEIFLGLDVGKTDHGGCAVTADGTKIWNKTLPNDEAKLTKVYQDLSAKGTVLVVAVAQHLGITVAYLPGLTMRRIADMYPGTATTDEKDSFIIADAARTMPHTLRSLQVSDEEEAALGHADRLRAVSLSPDHPDQQLDPRALHPNPSLPEAGGRSVAGA